MTNDENNEELDNGRDEPNLVELPYFINTQRSKDSNTIKYSSTIICPKSNKRIPRSLTITAGDKDGMPNAWCGKVILGALQFDLCQETNDTTTFSYRALAKVLGIDPGSKSLQRIKLALNRYVATTLHYENSWYDRRNEEWKSQSFHIIDSLVHDKDGVTVRWGREFLVSLQEGYLKPLDLKLFRSLKSSHSEILFRFLDKKFYRRSECDFLFSDLAHNHLGFDKSVEIRELKRRLKKPIEELEAHCFIARDPNRFYKSQGKWRVKFRKPTKQEEDADQQMLLIDDKVLEQRYRDVGFSLSQFKDLAEKYKDDPERLEKQLEHVLYLRSSGRSIKSLVPYLISVLADNPELPAKMTTEAQRIDLELERTQQRRKEERERLEAEKKATQEWDNLGEKINTYLDSLNEKERKKILTDKSISKSVEGSTFWLLAVEDYLVNAGLMEKD